MSEVMFALVGSFLAAVGARDQLLVARFGEAFGQSGSLLAISLFSATLSAFIAAWVGSQLAGIMSISAATMFVAFALLASAFELAWPNRVKSLYEPTRSFSAVFIILFARQLSDASRFIILALAVILPSHWLVGLGGAIGGSAAVAIGWSLGYALEKKLPLRNIRTFLAVILGITGIVIGLNARGIIV